MKSRLPEDLRREINRTAYALAQRTFAEQRRRLQGQALEVLRSGGSLADALRKVIEAAT